MSSIGMLESFAEHGDFALVRYEGGSGGYIMDCDGEYVLSVAENQMEAAAKAFPTIIAMYEKAYELGGGSGRRFAQYEMRKALGMEDTLSRLDRLCRSVFPGESNE